MIKFGLSILCFLVIPFLMGSLITHFMKRDNKSVLLSWLIGYFFEFAIAEITTLIFTFMGKSFNNLFYTCFGIFLILSIFSIIINFKNIIKIPIIIKEETKDIPKGMFALCMLLIGVQCFTVFCFMHVDSDDSNFVAKATINLHTDSLYVYDDVGVKYTNLPARYVLSPFPVYTALVSKFTGYHPMIIAHTILPLIITLLIYTNYYLLSKKMFDNDKKKSLLFLIFINIIYVFGNFSNRTNFTFMLVRLWQGKAILGNLILPSIITFYFMYIKENEKFAYWIVLFLTMFSSCLVSTMGLALAPILIMALTIVYCLSKFSLKSFKKSLVLIFKLGIKSALCCIPNMICAVMYLLLKLKGDAN